MLPFIGILAVMLAILAYLCWRNDLMGVCIAPRIACKSCKRKATCPCFNKHLKE